MILSMKNKEMRSDELNIGNDSFEISKFSQNDYMSHQNSVFQDFKPFKNKKGQKKRNYTSTFFHNS